MVREAVLKPPTVWVRIPPGALYLRFEGSLLDRVTTPSIAHAGDLRGALSFHAQSRSPHTSSVHGPRRGLQRVGRSRVGRTRRHGRHLGPPRQSPTRRLVPAGGPRSALLTTERQSTAICTPTCSVST